MTEKLDLLVVDDTRRHQESARELLLGHNLRIAETYSEAVDMIKDRAPQVLMTDLYFPYGERSPTRDSYQPRALGFSLALFASRPANNVERIAIYTDANHHSDAVSATFDSLYVCDERRDDTLDKTQQERSVNGRPVFRVNNSNLLIFDERDIRSDLYISSQGIKTYQEIRDIGEEVDYNRNVKNWKELLDLLSGL